MSLAKGAGARRALLVISRDHISHLEEALAIAESASYEVVDIVRRPKPGRRLSDEAVKNISARAQELGVDAIIYYGNLEPSSMYKLERASKVKVLDRVLIILEIFALHAGSKEAKLQIEMARLKHELPLVREYIRRAKLGEQVDFLGPGRYAFESYEKYMISRIARIRRELDELRRRVRTQELARRDSGFILASIVGYASAGKTSIFNAITGERQPTGPEYFTTLFAKHKLVDYRGAKIMLIDTVGFVRDVPAEIIESFYSTLQEAALADVLIFVIDSSEDSDTIKEKLQAGISVLSKLNAINKPIILALNKVDLVPEVELGAKESTVSKLAALAGLRAQVVRVSALKGLNLDLLLEKVASSVGRPGEPTEAVRQGVRAKAGTQAGA